VSTFNLTSPAKTLHHLAVLAIFDSLVWLLTYSACACVYMHVNVLFINLSSYIIYMSVFMLLTYCYGLYMIYLPHDHVFEFQYWDFVWINYYYLAFLYDIM
jgi:hypothetical protein